MEADSTSGSTNMQEDNVDTMLSDEKRNAI